MVETRDIGRRTARKVLIVEDNELNMRLLNDLLEAHGYLTFQTGEGLEALRIARLYRPDLILMDIRLPEISGLEITGWLKEDEDLRGIPVVAVTAFAMPGDEEKMRRRLRRLYKQADIGSGVHADDRPLQQQALSSRLVPPFPDETSF